MSADLQETWRVRKPALRAPEGLVAGQHHLAALAGARVLGTGGNAVDAAIAASFALGVVEPWMSGIGGGGHMLVAPAGGGAHAVSFGMVAPRALDPADYPLGPGGGSDLFAWPGVLEDRNVMGPLSICVPGLVDGLGLAHARFASRPWAELVAPAIALAEDGLPVTWHTSLRIAIAARDLARFEATRAVYLPDGLPPVPAIDGKVPRLPLGRLAATLRRLAEAGARDLYEGELARALVADVEAVGGRLTLADLVSYRSEIVAPLEVGHGGARLHLAPGLTAGPAFARCIELLDGRLAAGSVPSPEAYVAWADALFRAYDERLSTMGDRDGCTSHLSVVDADGTMVSLTQTLLSAFGSRIVSPATGILLNNGVMWFDPRPGRPNSIAPGRRPLSNMCPLIASDGEGPRLALGASGGRRILPAVLQIASLLIDGGMDLEEAFHTPRIDISGEETLTADPRLPEDVLAALGRRFAVERRAHMVYPGLFACPSAVLRNRRAGVNVGMGDVMNPLAAVVAAC